MTHAFLIVCAVAFLVVICQAIVLGDRFYRERQRYLAEWRQEQDRRKQDIERRWEQIRERKAALARNQV